METGKIKNIVIIALIVLVVVLGGYLAVKALMPKDEAADGPLYATAEVTRGDIEVGVEATGTLEASWGGGISVPYTTNSEGQPISYNIEKVYVRSGDVVKAGAPLVQLSAPSLSSQIDSLTEQLESERKSLANMLGVDVADVDYIDPSSGISIRAPIDGRLSGLGTSVSKELVSGEVIGKVVDDSAILVDCYLTPGEINLIKSGSRAVVRFTDTYEILPAKINDVNYNASSVPSDTLQIDGGQTNDSGSYEFVYDVTLEVDNPGLLHSGLTCSVGIYTPDSNFVFSGTSPAGTMWLRYLGSIDEYASEENITSTVDGVVTEVKAKNNSVVKKGDVIITMAGQDVREEVEKRLDSIREKKMSLASLRMQEGSLTITAPTEGMVAELDAKEGGSASAGDWLGSIFSSSNMQMSVQIDDTDILLVNVGSPVRITMDALPDAEFTGKVDYISGMGKTEGGASLFEVSISVQGSEEIRSGMQARAYIDSGSAKDVLLIPAEAVFREDGFDKVEVLEDNGVVNTVTVEVGLVNDRYAEIRSGLEEGQVVITGSSSDLLPSQESGGSSFLPADNDSGGSDEGESNEGEAEGGDNSSGGEVYDDTASMDSMTESKDMGM